MPRVAIDDPSEKRIRVKNPEIAIMQIKQDYIAGYVQDGIIVYPNKRQLCTRHLDLLFDLYCDRYYWQEAPTNAKRKKAMWQLTDMMGNDVESWDDMRKVQTNKIMVEAYQKASISQAQKLEDVLRMQYEALALLYEQALGDIKAGVIKIKDYNEFGKLIDQMINVKGQQEGRDPAAQFGTAIQNITNIMLELPDSVSERVMIDQRIKPVSEIEDKENGNPNGE